MYLWYFVAWFPIVILAFANATIRQAVYGRYLGELSAHQLSTPVLCGLIWVFETVLGHYVLGDPWSQVLRDYNVLEGRIWPLVLLMISPYVFYEIGF